MLLLHRGRLICVMVPLLKSFWQQELHLVLLISLGFGILLTNAECSSLLHLYLRGLKTCV